MTTTPPWTAEELREFDELLDMTGSQNQVTRINGRLDMNKFVAMHGNEKCDAMYVHLESKGKS